MKFTYAKDYKKDSPDVFDILELDKVNHRWRRIYSSPQRIKRNMTLPGQNRWFDCENFNWLFKIENSKWDIIEITYEEAFIEMI